MVKTVLYVCPFTDNLNSGVQRFAAELVNGIRTTHINSHTLFWDKSKSFVIGYLLFLKKFISLVHKVELVHFMVLTPYVFPLLMLTKMFRKKSVITYHGIYTYEVPFGTNPLEYILFFITDKVFRKFSNRIVSSDV